MLAVLNVDGLAPGAGEPPVLGLPEGLAEFEGFGKPP
jgi:hypothetical protein